MSAASVGFGGLILKTARWLMPRAAGIVRARRELIMPVLSQSPEHEMGKEADEAAEKMFAARDFDGLLVTLRRQIAGRLTDPMGIRLFECTLRGVFAELFRVELNTDASEQALAPFSEWYAQADPDPDVAALLARALQIVGHSHQSGSNWRSRQTGGVRMEECYSLANAILEKHRAAGQDSLLWRRSWFRSGLTDTNSPRELRDRFEQYLACDPLNVMAYRERAYHLLPRWHGSYGEIEAFARESAERTESRYGDALYAQVYIAIMDHENLPRDSDAEWDRIERGTRDCMRIWPGPIYANHLADLAMRFDKRALTRHVFENEIEQLRLDCWRDTERPFEVYAWACGYGPQPV